MENKIAEPENKKSMNDFMKLFLGIVIVIMAMVALKLLAGALGIM